MMPKTKTPEQFIAQSLVSNELFDKFSKNLAQGALRFVAVNGEPVKHRKLGNNEAKVAEVLDYTTLAGGGILDKNPEFIDKDIENNLISADNIPDAHFDLQKRIAKERGYGDIEITSDLKRLEADTLRADQRDSLSRWSDYLRDESNEATYPDWFKVYAWESVKRLSDFNKETGEFKRRTATSTGVYPELDAEALAYVYDAIDLHVLQGDESDDERLTLLLEGANFGKLYAHAVERAGTGITPERREIITGVWRKYDQIEGHYTPDYAADEQGEAADRTPVKNATATRLAESLQAHRTGWCTAGNRTAAHQLTAGDFYVYYSEDEDGNNTIPRIAIRMDRGVVAEVRGIEKNQELEISMHDIALTKLNNLPGGDKYFDKAENMRRLTEIDNRVGGGGELMPEDLLFLRFSGRIEGFGYRIDPRIDNLIKGRRERDDMAVVLAAEIVNPTALVEQIIDRNQWDTIANNLTPFIEAGVDIDLANLVKKLIDRGQWHIIANNLTQFIEAGSDIDPTTFAKELIDRNQWDTIANNLTQFIEAGSDIDPTAIISKLKYQNKSYIIANNLTQFIEAGSDIDPTTFAKELIDRYGWDLFANNLTQFIEAGADATTIVKKLIDGGQGYNVANNLTPFIEAGVDATALAKQLIDGGQWYVILNNLTQLHEAGADIDPITITKQLIDQRQWHILQYNITPFIEAGVDATALAKQLIDGGLRPVVEDSFDQFLKAGVPRDVLRKMLY